MTTLRPLARYRCQRDGHDWMMGQLVDERGAAVIYDVCVRCRQTRAVEPKATTR